MCRRSDIDTKINANIQIQDMGYESPCHIWTGSHSGNGRGGGYPRMSLDGQTVAVHIVTFTNKNGFVPGKKQIDHMCNNRMCVNPDHLQMVTHKQNQKLRIKRSRKVNDASNSLDVSQLCSNDTSIHDGGRTKILLIRELPEDEEASTENGYDGRYLPDHAFWETTGNVLSSPSNSSSSSK